MSEAVIPAAQEPSADWWVQVRGQAYGPYSKAQMIQYLGEGRVRPGTPVTRDPQGEWTEARRVDALMSSFRASLRPPANSNATRIHDSEEPANIFVHAEIVSGAFNPFLSALESLGAFCQLAPGLWLVRTRFSAGIIRNMLSQTLERGDRFVVIDATRDRFAWFNLGPEIDVKIKDVWNAPLRADAVR